RVNTVGRCRGHSTEQQHHSTSGTAVHEGATKCGYVWCVDSPRCTSDGDGRVADQILSPLVRNDTFNLTNLYFSNQDSTMQPDGTRTHVPGWAVVDDLIATA
ncbi:unnamed protein product, partial [Pylaiella littoralis]